MTSGNRPKVYSVKDSFPGVSLAANWVQSGMGQQPQVTVDGGLRFTYAPTELGWSYVEHNAELDLTGSCVSIEQVEGLSFPFAANAEFFIAIAPVVALPGDSLGLALRPGFAVAGYTIDGGNSNYPGAVAFNPGRSRYRIREAGGIIYWEASIDGGSYEAFYLRSAPFPVDRVALTLGAGNWTRYDAGSRVIVGDLNQR